MSEARSYDYPVQYEVRVRVNVNAQTPEEAAQEAQRLLLLLRGIPITMEVIDPRGDQSLIRVRNEER
jgi:hypothetical protein